ncbi:MAG TPA: discoidin domain-containing protein [Desulfomonilaceae bacterium]|nr:discoidin domain-containing protein [Desulfomonilaceae bacterium]
MKQQPMKSAPESDGPETRPRAQTASKPPRRIARFFFAILYIAFLALIVVGVLAGIEYYAYLQVKASPVGQAYKGRSMDNARLSTQKVAPQYGYEPTPGFAAVRNTRLGNSFEYINEESFKDFEEVPVEKPADEYRIIVTGASVVYGRGPVPPSDVVADFYEVTFRWTIPHLMEQIFNADPQVREKIGGKRVRVINAGVPGYVYQNNLMRYLAKLRLFQPDLVISLDGANELPAVARPLKDWNYFTHGQYFEVITDVMDMGSKGLVNYVALWLKRNTYFFTWLAIRRGEGTGTIQEDRGFTALPQDPTPEMMEYLKRNIAQVTDIMAIYHKTLEADRVPHVFAVQPMFRNSKKPRTPMEQKIESVTGMEKVGFFYAAPTYDLLVDKIKTRGREVGIEVADFTGIYDNVTEWVFTDWCHLTNGANYVLAKALVNRVKTDVFKLPLQPDDEIRNPSDSYFVDYAKNSRVLVDDKPAGTGMHILKGYPGTELLEARSDGRDGAPKVTLDLGSVQPVSRLRIVWGDAQSVPQAWQVDISEDGATWKSWYKTDKTSTDNYDQWPGFEYYAGHESPARFVRYTATSNLVRLRQLSLFR